MFEDVRQPPPLRADPAALNLVLSCVVLGCAMLLQWVLDPGPAWGPIEVIGGGIVAFQWIIYGLLRLPSMLDGR